MIGRLSGRLIGEEPTGLLVLDVAGVGYELHCPIGTVGRAEQPDEAHDHLTLFVHTNLRQDALELFGFCSAEERATFRQLISVPNVGPRLALSVLHVLPSEELARAIEQEDRARLGKVPGVGKKTAERLVLELRGKLAVSSQAPVVSSSPSHQAKEGGADQRLVLALTGLGYRPAEAERAARTVSVTAGMSLSEQLREALKALAP